MTEVKLLSGGNPQIAKGDGDGMKDFHYGKGDMVNNQKAAGWEIDNYKLEYKEVSYTFAVHIKTNFPDMDGSEKHYVLVEKPFDAKWELGDLSGTGLSDLTPLLSLPSLTQLALDESMRAAAEAIAPEASFEITYE